MKISPSLLRRSTRVNLKVLVRVAIAGHDRKVPEMSIATDSGDLEVCEQCLSDSNVEGEIKLARTRIYGTSGFLSNVYKK